MCQWSPTLLWNQHCASLVIASFKRARRTSFWRACRALAQCTFSLSLGDYCNALTCIHLNGVLSETQGSSQEWKSDLSCLHRCALAQPACSNAGMKVYPSLFGFINSRFSHYEIPADWWLFSRTAKFKFDRYWPSVVVWREYRVTLEQLKGKK